MTIMPSEDVAINWQQMPYIPVAKQVSNIPVLDTPIYKETIYKMIENSCKPEMKPWLLHSKVLREAFGGAYWDIWKHIISKLKDPRFKMYEWFHENVNSCGDYDLYCFLVNEHRIEDILSNCMQCNVRTRDQYHARCMMLKRKYRTREANRVRRKMMTERSEIKKYPVLK